MELRSSGDAMQALPLCLKRSGVLEACCACRDVEEAEVWSSGALAYCCCWNFSLSFLKALSAKRLRFASPVFY